MRIIDLRSDTITKPTDAMRRAMATAEVGDDVFGEDPTVNRLEEMAAERLGKEAALFVASGTMGNLVCQLTHCARGEEVIMGELAHIMTSEQAGAAALGGIQPRTIPNQPDGKLSLDDIETAIRPDNIHCPRTRLIALENTHNRCYGSPLEVEYVEAVAQLAHSRGLRLHIDGARIFNAAVALGVEARKLVDKADSVTFCLSKGLAAPVGSVICGSREFIQEARRVRKVLGGGMRQAGILAAAGIVALNEMVQRLAEDHDNARRLAEGLAEMNGIEIDPSRIKTNILFFEIKRDDLTSEQLISQLNRQGVRMGARTPKIIRAVTNYHIKKEDIDHALGVLKRVLNKNL
ncbi:MAG: low-specificity L-threonine aldolase [Deltaproteobacteria bacterium]|nr:low-specificity L-threonine aldolase [Deltaproteobacteria bacterium]MBW1993098.1 low-specificity L-threonine aldolase [Deltaproteobacteria bacterium]MBW2152823.1 low-specificity L-threonine aldolase [Deltaproteobacteria bacterium]